MLNLPYSIKKKRISNPVMGAANPPVNLESARTTMQQPGNLAEQNCKRLITKKKVLFIGPQAR